MGFKEYITEYYGSSDDVMFADELDDAIIGFDPNLWKVVYSRTKCIDICIKDGMSEDEAIEYLDFNTFGGYVGEKTPVWVDDYKFDLRNG